MKRISNLITAFTIIELLSTIAIIALLSSLILPVLSQAKSSVRRAKCMSNHRQVTIGWILYVNDNNSKLASNDYVSGGGNSRRPLWVQGYYNVTQFAPDSTNAALLMDGRYALLAHYVRSAWVYKCPSDESSVNIEGRDYVRPRSVAMNWQVGWIGDHAATGPSGKIHNYDHQLSEPSRTFVFIDVDARSICWPFFGIQRDDSFFMVPAMYHKGASALSFSDGHTEIYRWQDARTKTQPKTIEWHRHNYPSPFNSDLKYLRQISGMGPKF